MMKRRNTALLIMPLMLSVVCGNSYAGKNHDGFIAGACAIGAGLFAAAAGAVALADWCFSETDDQLIARVDRECRSIDSQYMQTMNYFGQRMGVDLVTHSLIQYIPETVLCEFATFVWNSNTSQSCYSSEVWSAKSKLQSCVRDLRKRVHSLEGKYNSYEDQKRLSTMQSLLQNADQLLARITLFADCLRYHESYFNLYDSVGNIRNRYLQHVTIIESGRYSISSEIKRYIISCDSSQYAFKNFVKNITFDISLLQTNIDSLAHNYESGKLYAFHLMNQLIDIKNIVVSDPRYQEELYQWEQARLERQRIETLEAQARLERERVKLEREHNRILEERNRIERQKMYNIPPARITTPMIEEVSITVSF